MANKLNKLPYDSESAAYLTDGRPKFQSLGCGYHKGVYYFGTKLFRDGRACNAIITSDRKMYVQDLQPTIVDGKKVWVGPNDIRNKFNLRYKDDFQYEALDNVFDKDAIRRHLSNATTDISLKKTFDKLVKLFKKFIYLGEEVEYGLLACYRIASFYMPVWKTRARLFFHADYGSGKSRTTSLLHNLGFNSINLGDWTPAFMQRVIESTCGETHIDDMESLDEEKQKATERLLKVGYMKGFQCGKVGSDNRRKLEVYSIFNTTTINNTVGIDAITADRCITIRIPKIASAKYDEEPDFSDPIFKEIRDSLYILGLRDAEKVAKAYRGIKSEKIHGRLLSIIKPELTIAKLISKDLFNRIETWWEEQIQDRDDSFDLTTDWPFRAYVVLYDLVVQRGKVDYIPLFEDIVKPLISELYGDDPTAMKTYRYKMSITLGRVFNSEKRFKKKRMGGGVQYRIAKKDLIQMLTAKRLLKPVCDFLGCCSVDSVDSVVGGMTKGGGEEESDNSFSAEEGGKKRNNTINTPYTLNTNNTNNTNRLHHYNKKGKSNSISKEQILASIKGCYGKSGQKNLANERDICEYWEGRLTQKNILDWIDCLKSEGAIYSPQSGFYEVVV